MIYQVQHVRRNFEQFNFALSKKARRVFSIITAVTIIRGAQHVRWTIVAVALWLNRRTSKL
jgi:hypothetical protein